VRFTAQVDSSAREDWRSPRGIFDASHRHASHFFKPSEIDLRQSQRSSFSQHQKAIAETNLGTSTKERKRNGLSSAVPDFAGEGALRQLAQITFVAGRLPLHFAGFQIKNSPANGTSATMSELVSGS